MHIELFKYLFYILVLYFSRNQKPWHDCRCWSHESAVTTHADDWADHYTKVPEKCIKGKITNHVICNSGINNSKTQYSRDSTRKDGTVYKIDIIYFIIKWSWVNQLFIYILCSGRVLGGVECLERMHRNVREWRENSLENLLGAWAWTWRGRLWWRQRRNHPMHPNLLSRWVWLSPGDIYCYWACSMDAVALLFWL